MSKFDIGAIQLDPKREPPRIQIDFGYTLAGGYRMHLWDPDNATPIGSGVNTDQLPDIHPVGKAAAALDGHEIGVELRISVIPGTNYSPSGPYSATIRVWQGSAEATGSPIELTGKLKQGVAGRLGYIKLSV